MTDLTILVTFWNSEQMCGRRETFLRGDREDGDQFQTRDKLELGRKRQGRQETNFRPRRRSPADPGDKYGDRPSKDFHGDPCEGFSLV